jgi:hypothetical protein
VSIPFGPAISLEKCEGPNRTSLLPLVCGVSQASPATPPHHLEPNAPRSVTVSEAQTPPVIRAGLLQSTRILLPAEEKIATVFGGDTVDWVFDGGHVASRFISVKPKLANTTTDIHIVSDHGNEYGLPSLDKYSSSVSDRRRTRKDFPR